MSVESKLEDVLQAVQALATHIDERFATKEDLKQFATKEDLKRFATKDDLALLRAEMSTKEDLKQFATKDDFRNFEIGMKKDLRQFEERMTNRITSHIDEFVVVHWTSDMEIAAVRSRCDRMEDFMEDVADRLNMDFERT